MQELHIPKNVSEIYDNPSRFSQCFDRFKQEFHTDAFDVAVRAPGRVNLIGEHIDYNGYSVLPMAIEQDIIILAKKNPGNGIKLANVDPKYSHMSISEGGSGNTPINSSEHHWANYILAGMKGVLLHFGESVEMVCMVSGNVPAGSGLSSSSALVCAAALTTLLLIKKEMKREELANLCAQSEKFVGTQGGGMDQAISFLGSRGNAKLISFNPLRTEDVSLPPNACFVIANSCVESLKAESASTHFNKRVVECRLSSLILAKYLNIPWQSVKKLQDVQLLAKKTLEEMILLVKQHILPKEYSLQEIADILQTDVNFLTQNYLGNVKSHSFELYKRSLHVYTEAHRVLQFKSICDKNKQKLNSDEEEQILIQLGNLMNDSQTSCSQDYECSHSQLDALCQQAIKHGAYGSRLTGAGWGGCTVNLVHRSKVNQFIASLKQDYFINYLKRDFSNAFDDVLFATLPGHPAYQLTFSN